MPTTPPYKTSYIPAYISRPKIPNSLPMYIPLSGHPYCGHKRNDLSTLITTNHTTYTNHKLSHE